MRGGGEGVREGQRNMGNKGRRKMREETEVTTETGVPCLALGHIRGVCPGFIFFSFFASQTPLFTSIRMERLTHFAQVRKTCFLPSQTHTYSIYTHTHTSISSLTLLELKSFEEIDFEGRICNFVEFICPLFTRMSVINTLQE